jgi:hypothetical protein
MQSHSHHNPAQQGAGTPGHSHSHSHSSAIVGGGDNGMDPPRHSSHAGSRQQVRTTTGMGVMPAVGGVKRRRWSVEQGPSVV